MKGAIVLDQFLSLPRKCQEMFFERMESFCGSADYLANAYMPFYVVDIWNNECKSPIEIIFDFAFKLYVFDNSKKFIYLTTQEEIFCGNKKYIADFVFDTSNLDDGDGTEYEPFKLVIECDGFEYHHANKQQVQKDVDRDHDLKMEGYDIIHFTGSEIYNDPYKCAEYTLNYILKNLKVKEV